MAEMRKKANEEWEEIRNNDIIGLMETWEESGQKIKSKLDDFECGSIEAIKEHKQGRARGGMIMAITIK